MTLALADDDIRSLLDHVSLVAALEAAHRRLARGEAVQPIPAALSADPGTATAPGIVPMTALDTVLGLCAVKVLADAPANRAVGLPAQRSTIALFDAVDGSCVALADGREVTRQRTAAASVMASRLLASDVSVLGLVGAGALAVEHVRAHAEVLGTRRVVVWSRSQRTREAFAESVAPLVEVTLASDPAEVFEAAATVCTLTPSETPYVRREWVRPGTHVNAVGSPPRPHFSELRPEVPLAADVIAVDSRPVAAAESGNVAAALRAGLPAARLSEVGDILTGKAGGRTSPGQVTVFNSVGIGLQDLAAAALLLERAAAAGRGTRVELRTPETAR